MIPDKPDKPVKTDKDCSFRGKIYKSGDRFPDLEACNDCFCSNGGVGCTEMACLSGKVL